MRLDPATATAPPAASGSAETDREALVAFSGENWSRSDLAERRAPRRMVTTNDDGRVTTLNLDNNDLSGEIPPELGNLSNLTSCPRSRQKKMTAGAGQPLQPDNSEPRQQRLERGDTAGAGQPLQPGRAVSQPQRLERGDRAGQESAGPQRQRLERGDTAGAGQPLQPDSAVPRPQPLSGEIPPELGNLSLIWLILGSLEGRPPELGSLSNLIYLLGSLSW